MPPAPALPFDDVCRSRGYKSDYQAAFAAAIQQPLMQPLPRLLCNPTRPGFVIDGRLDKAAWRHATSVELFLISGGRPTYRTTVRTLWSSSELYVGFDCEDPQPNASMRRRDDPLFQEGNVVELYVDPAGEGTTSFEFEINPLGTLMDLFYDRLDMGWRDAIRRDAEGARAAAQIIRNASTRQPTGWTAELCVPLRNFHTAARLPPQVGDVWRVNFCRYNTVSTPATDYLELCAWSPTFEKRFNLPHRFGLLEFA